MGFLAQVLTTVAGRVVILLVGLASLILLARSLGEEGQGMYALGVQVCTWATLLTGLGIDLGIAYHEAQNDRSGQMIAFLTRLGLVWGGVIALITWGVTQTIRKSLLQDVPNSVLIWSVLCVPVLLILNYQLAYLWGRNRLVAYNGIVIFQTVLLLVLQVGLIIVWEGGVVGALIAFFLAQSTTIGLVFVLNRAPVRPGGMSIPLSRIWTWIRFGFKGQLSSVLALLLYRLDLFLLNAFAEMAEVGHYSIAINVTNSITYLTDAAAFALFPRVTAATQEEAETFLPVVCRNTLFISSLGALVLGVISPWLVWLFYGKAYLAAVTPLRLLLPGVVASSLNKPIINYQLGQGRSQVVFYVTLLTVPVILGTFFWLIPRWGMVGAALASSCSYIVTTMINLGFLARFSHVRLTEVLLIRAGDWARYLSWFNSIRQAWADWTR